MSLSASWNFLENEDVIRVGINDLTRPYIVPLNFVVINKEIYFHSAKDGRKVNLFKNGEKVSVLVDKMIDIKESKKGCSFSCYYQSVMVEGLIYKILDKEKKVRALNALVEKYASENFSKVTIEDSERVFVYCIKVKDIIGKELLPNN